MPDTPLNPDALEVAARATYEMRNPESWAHSWEELDLEEREEEWVKPARTVATAYLAVAHPVVNSVEELDQLPPHTVIEEHEQGHGVLIKRGPRSWECLTHYVSGLPSGDIELPARVLYRPTKESTNGR